MITSPNLAFAVKLMLTALVAALIPPASAQPADLIFHNATVWTVDSAQPTAHAVAIRGDRFLAGGDNDSVLKHRGPNTQVIDLGGRFVLPGFIDTHVHFAQAAAFLEFNIMAVTDQATFARRVEDLVKKLAEDEWIVGGYWGAYDQWALGSAGGQNREPFTPDIRSVADLTRRHPVFLNKFDNSEYAANVAAMKAAGIDPDNPQADGVEFQRDSAGKPTGIMKGRRVSALFNRVVPRRFGEERRKRQTVNALKDVARYGVTTVCDMSDDAQLRIYQDLRRSGGLTTRVSFRYGLDRWRELADRGIKAGGGDEWIRLGTLKGHIDGIMGTSSARFFEGYSNDSANRGRWRPLMVDERGDYVEGKFLNYLLGADKAGLQICVHAIGDEANHLLLNYLEEMIRQNGVRDRRFHIVHAQVVGKDDLPRFGKLGVIAEVQPFHLSDDMRWMEQRIGAKRCEGAYAFKQLADSGALLCFGSDWPGTSASEYPINPLLALYAATTRQTLSGQPSAGWFPDQRIDIRAAIKAHTYDAAYAGFEEKNTGSIAAGKLADLVVLSRNLLEIPPKDILNTEVLYTVVAGKLVYRKE
jgi:predicted amidohydrolase YtcJ